MKRAILSLLALIFSVALANAVSITVKNSTGYNIRYLYISTGTSDSWEEDVLGTSVLMNGKSVSVNLPHGGVWDIKAVDSDGDNYFKWNVNVSDNSTVTFTLSDMNATRETDPGDNTYVTVTNGTGYTIYYLYMSRKGVDSWEEDVLDEEVLMDGSKVRIKLPGPGVWDFKAVDRDKDSYTRYGVTINKGNNSLEFKMSDMD